LSLITKEGAARYIAQARKASAPDVVILGDSMYVPHAPKAESWLTRLGERASGQVRPTLGNRTDANMERGVPGALTLSVGTTGDPRPDHLFVLGGKGPSVTRRVLESVASKPAGAPRALGKGEAVRIVASAAALLASVVGAYYLFIHGFADMVSGWENGLHGLMREGDALFGAAAGTVGLGYYGSSRGIVNPASDYQRARAMAVDIARRNGAAESEVRFVEATASMPARNGEHWKYAFEIPGAHAGKALVYVDSRRLLGGGADLSSSYYHGASAPEGKNAVALAPHLFAKGAAVDPQSALDAVRRAAPGFGSLVSVALDYRQEAVTGDADLWYRFYNNEGSASASVNARTAEVRLEAGAVRAGPVAAELSSGPIGFSEVIYAPALEAARGLAEKAGYSPDKLRFEGASLSPTARGQRWSMTFVSPREDYVRDPREYSVTVHRLISRGEVFSSVSSADRGRTRMYSTVPAAAVPEMLKVSATGAMTAAGPGARSVGLQSRWPDEGPAQLWYVVRGEKGREIAAFHAGTGAVAVPKPYEALKQSLITGGLVAFTIALYAAIYYAIAHAPAATSTIQIPDGWQGGVPDGAGWGSLLGAGVIGAALGRAKTPAPKPADADVRARAAAVSIYKGYPWSQTEYNSAYYPALENLKSAGATDEQIALFERLCAEAPLRGGRFNPWSGD
jgi:hypothetical protein